MREPLPSHPGSRRVCIAWKRSSHRSVSCRRSNRSPQSKKKRKRKIRVVWKSRTNMPYLQTIPMNKLMKLNKKLEMKSGQKPRPEQHLLQVLLILPLILIVGPDPLHRSEVRSRAQRLHRGSPLGLRKVTSEKIISVCNVFLERWSSRIQSQNRFFHSQFWDTCS